MHRFGVLNLYFGVIMAATGLFVGFYKMISSNGQENVDAWLAVIPLGFVFMVLGMGITVLYKNRNS